MNDNEKICPECGEVINLESDYFIEHDGEFYHKECFDNAFVTCDDCGEIVRRDNTTCLDNLDKVVCDDCLENSYVQCYYCNEWIDIDDAKRGADDNWYCEECWSDRFTYCDNCGEVIWREDSYYNEDDDCLYCEYCYNNLQPPAIYSYHDDRVEYIPKYMDDVDRNRHYEQLYGLELEITGDTYTAEHFQELMGDNVVLMHDGSVDGYEMITMPLSREYFYKKFVPILEKGLKYLIEQGMTGHNGGGIHIHFKELQRGLQVANMTQILYGSNNDRDIWQKISQRKSDKIEAWCSMTNNSYTPDEIIEYDKIYPRDAGCHGTALNYDYRTETHELRIFNSSLRLDRVLKNMECLFALEDYVRMQDELVCTTQSFLKFVDNNPMKYRHFVDFLHEKGIFNMAHEFYGDTYKSVPSILQTIEE